MSAAKSAQKDYSFETALKELEDIVRGLETGQTSLEDSIQAYEKGISLKKICEEKIKDAKLRVEKITLEGDNLKVESFDANE